MLIITSIGIALDTPMPKRPDTAETTYQSKASERNEIVENHTAYSRSFAGIQYALRTKKRFPAK